MTADTSTRLREAIGLLRRTQLSPLFGIFDAVTRAKIEDANARTTNEIMQGVMADPARVVAAWAALGPFAQRLREVMEAALRRMAGAGWDFGDDAQVKALNRLSPDGLRMIYDRKLGPNAVSISPVGAITVLAPEVLPEVPLSAAMDAVRSAGDLLRIAAESVNEPTEVRLRRAAMEAASLGAPYVGRFLNDLANNPTRSFASQAFVGPISTKDREAFLNGMIAQAVSDGASQTNTGRVGRKALEALPSSTIHHLQEAVRLTQEAAAMCGSGGSGPELASLAGAPERAAKTWRQDDALGRSAVADVVFSASVVLLDVAAECGDPSFDVNLPTDLTRIRPGDLPPGQGPGPGPSASDVDEAIAEAEANPVEGEAEEGPAKPEPTPSPVQALRPTRAQIVTYIEAMDGDLAAAEALLAAAFSDWNEPDEVLAGAREYVRGVAADDARFVLLWSTAPESSLLQGPDVWNMAWVLRDAGAQQFGPDVWRLIAVPQNRADAQRAIWTGNGAQVLTEDEFDRRASVAGPSPLEREDGGLPEPTMTPGLYYITQEGADYVGSLDDVAYANVLRDDSGSLPGATAPDDAGWIVSGDFGQVLLAREDSGEYPGACIVWAWTDDDVPAPGTEQEASTTNAITGFLSALEKLNIAACGSDLCVSDVLAARAQAQGTTNAEVYQGVYANLSVWTTRLAVALQSKFNPVRSTLNGVGGTPEFVWLEDGPAMAEITLTARPAEGSGTQGMVAFDLTYSSAIRGITFTESGIADFPDFLGGTDPAVALGNEAEGEEGVEAPGFVGITETEYADLLTGFRNVVERELRRTADKGAMLGFPPPAARSGATSEGAPA
jgi:hypothetical protein